MNPNDKSSHPYWWQSNERIKKAYNLPSYDAPRFQDGEYVHEVVNNLEEQLDVRIRFVNSEPVENGLWEISVDGEPLRELERYRDDQANSVFELGSESFRELVIKYSHQ